MDKNELFRALTPSLFDLIKVLITAVVILFVTKIQIVSDKLSALLIALPLTSIVAMLWMRHEKGVTDVSERVSKIGDHAYYTFWFVLPTMPMFLVLPWMLRKGWGFYTALGLNCLMTAALFWLTVVICKQFGIRLI